MAAADNIATHIRAYMRRRGLTQEQFAAEVGRAQSVISRWVNANYTWPADELIRVSDHLGVSVSALCDVTNAAGVEPTTPAPAERADGSAA